MCLLSYVWGCVSTADTGVFLNIGIRTLQWPTYLIDPQDELGQPEKLRQGQVWSKRTEKENSRRSTNNVIINIE